MVKIAFAQATYRKDFEETKLCVERVSPNVDFTLISYDQSLDDNELQWLVDNKEKFNIIPIKYNWKDDMPAMRNSYLEKAKELGIDWLCVSDPDELFSEQLANNLRSIIEKYDSEGYSILGVPVRDQFTCVGNDEWFDNLDRLKEYPAGYHETEYWKPMLIFKLFPDIKYEGIGIEKTVHETLTTRYKQKTLNLPKEYFYIHKKNAIKIWRNAARNMFLSGGGDNVGSKNRLWVQLKQICNQIRINTWNEFEEFVVTIGIRKYAEKAKLTQDQVNEFNAWLKAALKALPTKEGTETRELAKWYFALHQDEVDEKILELIKTVPEVTKESELENFVTQTYYQILGRHPDRTGLDAYVYKIMNKELKRHELADIFKNSSEYKEKFSPSDVKSLSGLKNIDNITNSSNSSTSSNSSNLSLSSDYRSNLNDTDKLRYDKVKKFVEQMYNKILGRVGDISGVGYYTEAIMKKQVRPVDLPDVFRNSEEYSNLRKGKMSLSSIGIITTGIMTTHKNDAPSKQELKMVNLSDNEKRNTVSLCIMAVRSELPFVVESIMNMKDVVDEIHIQTDDFSEEDVKKLIAIDKRVKVHLEKWKDDFSDYKNRCYGHATTEWVLILDADEIPIKELANNLRLIIENSNRGINYDMVGFDVIDTLTVDRKIVSENRNKGGKQLLHWNIPSIYYGDLHIWIKDNYYPFKSIHSDVGYKHVKEKDSVLERSARNVVIGGGGDTSKDKNNLWTELVDIRKELGLNTWKQTNEYLKKGNVDNRIIENFQKQSEKQWKDNELQDLKKYYLKLYPNEEDRFENLKLYMGLKNVR